MQSGESRGAEHTFLAWTGDPGDGAAPATKRLTLLTSRGLHRLPTLCVFFMTRATQRPKTYHGKQGGQKQTFEDSIKCCDFRLITVSLRFQHNNAIGRMLEYPASKKYLPLCSNVPTRVARPRS